MALKMKKKRSNGEWNLINLSSLSFLWQATNYSWDLYLLSSIVELKQSQSKRENNINLI